MSGEFDPLRAVSEELQGLFQIRNAMKTQERRASEAAAIADANLESVRQLLGFCDAELERKKAVRDELLRKKQEEAR